MPGSVVISSTQEIEAKPDGQAPTRGAAADAKTVPWYELYKREGLVTMALVRDNDSLRGFQLGYGIRGQSDEFPDWGTVSLTRMSHDGQSVTGVRGDMMMWLNAQSTFGVGPVLGLGLENRSEPPRSGFGGYLALGAESATMTRLHWQFAIDAEYDVGISSESRSRISLRLAYAHKNLTIAPLNP